MRRARSTSRASLTCLTGADVPGEGDTGPSRHDEPLFPPKSCFTSQPVAWVLGETLEAAQRRRQRACSASYEPLPGHPDDRAGHRCRAASSRNRCRLARGDMAAIGVERRCASTASWPSAARNTSISRRRRAIAWLDESGGIAVQSSTQHPSETQEIVARVLGRAEAPGDRRVPAHGRRVRRQGSPGQHRGRRSRRSARGRRGRPVRVRLTRAARHGAHRQAASVPGAILGRASPADGRIAGAEAGALLRRRLEPRPVRSRSCWRALFHCDNAYRLPAVDADRPRVPHAQDVADRVPRLRRPAGHAGDRGDPRAGARSGCRSPAHVVRERNFYREGDTTHYGQRVDEAGRIATIWTQLKDDERASRRRRAAVAAFNAQHPTTSSAASPSRR